MTVGIGIKFKKATKTSKTLDLLFNDEPVTLSNTNMDNNWTLDREMYVISRASAIRVLTCVSAASSQIPMTPLLFE